MGRLIAIEGVDGAGKHTAARLLSEAYQQRGLTVTHIAFPRYELDVHASLARDALYGRLGDGGEIAGSVHAMALLFALDRRDAAAELRRALREHDVVLLDRYLASNAAYGAARLQQQASGEFVRWITSIELDRFTAAVPDRQVLLHTPVAVAADRARHREHSQPHRPRDGYEADPGLQERTAQRYFELAERRWASPWIVLDGDAPPGQWGPAAWQELMAAVE